METLDLVAPATALGANRYKAILRLALPTVLAMLSQSVVNEIDVVYFSHFPCPESSTAQAGAPRGRRPPAGMPKGTGVVPAPCSRTRRSSASSPGRSSR